MTEEKKRYQMAFDVSKEMHTHVKVLAAMRNISVSCWIARAITDRIIKENKYNEKSYNKSCMPEL
jgi:predicted HicB family RNase H-like nuclease